MNTLSVWIARLRSNGWTVEELGSRHRCTDPSGVAYDVQRQPFGAICTVRGAVLPTTVASAVKTLFPDGILRLVSPDSHETMAVVEYPKAMPYRSPEDTIPETPAPRRRSGMYSRPSFSGNLPESSPAAPAESPPSAVRSSGGRGSPGR